MKNKTYPGINIQYPISKLIIGGNKSVETRTYPLPDNYVGKEMALIETPGKLGNFKSRVVAIITFGPSFKYENKTKFYADMDRHFVAPDSLWAWNPLKPKWGWPIIHIRVLKRKKEITQRLGIKYTKNISA